MITVDLRAIRRPNGLVRHERLLGPPIQLFLGGSEPCTLDFPARHATIIEQPPKKFNRMRLKPLKCRAYCGLKMFIVRVFAGQCAL